MNALEQNLSSIRIPAFGDVLLSEEVSRFIVSQINPNKGVDLIGRLKTAYISELTNDTGRCGFSYSRNREQNVIFR